MTQDNRTTDKVNQWREEARRVPLVDFVQGRYHIVLNGSGNNRFGPCPICHEGDDRFSIFVTENIWTCRKCPPNHNGKNAGGSSIDLVMLAEKIEVDAACEILTGRPKPAATVHQLRTKEGEYFYRDATGRAILRVDRYLDNNGKKSFVQFKPSGFNNWTKGGFDGEHVPYRLPELLANQAQLPVIIAEGERKCDALGALGFISSCNVGGTGMGEREWTEHLTPFFRGHDLIIVCDNDDKGRMHGMMVAGRLHPIASRVRILFIEDAWPCDKKKDIYDFIQQAQGDRAAAVADLLTKARDWPLPPEITGIHTTESEMVLAYIATNTDISYMPAHKEWFIRHSKSVGRVWIADVKMEVQHRVDQFVREHADHALTDKDRRHMLTKRFSDAIEGIARRELALDPAECDAERDLINTTDGLFDLRTGKLIDYNDRICLKISAVGPKPDMPCPLWIKFLERICEYDEGLISYLQRCAGYWLTGSTKEQKLFFLYGTGSNGKSVFMSTVAGIMNTYALPAPVELLLKTRYERHETEKAWLMGARLVRMSEPSEGERWHEGKVKELTGEDSIAARFTHGNFFRFPLQCKFAISGNNKPAFSQIDYAIKRRMVLIPFDVQIPEGERDVDLTEKLKPEWPAILAWMIEGARCWYEGGLMPPEKVLRASDEYMEDQDLVGQWVDECCDVGTDQLESLAALFASWRHWCEAGNEHIGTKQQLTARLNKMGFRKLRRNFGWVLKGIKVRSLV